MTELSINDAVPLYLYGIVDASTELADGLVGVESGVVQTVAVGDVAAVVTELEAEDGFATPDGLLAHTTVLDTIAQSDAILPMQFGTVVPSIAELTENVLGPQVGNYAESLATIEDAVQFTVRARYIQDVALTAMVEDNPEIAQLRQTVSGRSEDESRQERIRLGELVVASFDQMRPAHSQRITDSLAPYARDFAQRETSQAVDVAELALLIPRDRQTDFEEAVEDVAADLHEIINFRLIGPQAPYDFVD